MKNTKFYLLLIFGYFTVCNINVIQAQDISDDPKYLKLLDLAKCNMKIAEVEYSKGVTSEEGEKITPSRLDSKILLVKLEGTAYDFGRLSFNPALFGVNYIHKGSLTFAPVRAIGVRGKTPDGKKFEAWKSNPKVSFNTLVSTAGEAVNIWIAVEIPEKIKEFYLRIPANISEPVRFKQE